MTSTQNFTPGTRVTIIGRYDGEVVHDNAGPCGWPQCKHSHCVEVLRDGQRMTQNFDASGLTEGSV